MGIQEVCTTTDHQHQTVKLLCYQPSYVPCSECVCFATAACEWPTGNDEGASACFAGFPPGEYTYTFRLADDCLINQQCFLAIGMAVMSTSGLADQAFACRAVTL